MLGLLIIIVGVSTIAIIGFAEDIRHGRIHRNKTKKVIDHPKPKPEPRMTWASRQLLKEYNELPVESRPYNDIKPMLRALDIKYENAGNRDVSSSFGYHGYTSYETPAWRRWDGFAFDSPYRIMHERFEDVKNEIADQKHALEEKAHQDKIDEVAGDLASVDDLLERLNDEARARREATEELRNS